MRILVVDDEILVARYISQCIEKASARYRVVGTVTSGAKALEQIKSDAPDVVFTDITMPKMDGLELLRHIKERHPQISVILLTCHEEFTYVRQAMRDHADDYVLKSEINPEYIGKKLEQLLATRLEKERLENFAENRAAASVPVFQREGEGEVRIVTRQALSEPQFLLREDAFTAFAFLNTPQNFSAIIQELPPFFENTLLYKYNEFINVLICNLRHCDGCSSIEQKQNKIEEFTRAKSPHLEGPLKKSRLFYRLARLPQAIEEVVLLLETSFYGKTVFQNEAPEKVEEQLQSFSRQITEQTEKKDLESCCALIRELLDFSERSQPRLGALMDLLTRVIGMSCQLGGSKFKCRKISLPGSFALLREQVVSYSNDLLRSNHQYPEAIEKAIEYIKCHYREDLTLNSVAEHVFLSREYLSRQFKKEVGVNFSEYLMRLRLQEAKRLLQNTAMKTGEVAGHVGIPNVSYFTVAFKKQYGITPREMRNSR